jgi:hypothetical protein
MAQKLLENQTVDGSGSAVDVESGGYKIVRYYGTFDSCSIQVECDFDRDGNWVPAGDARTSATADYVQSAHGMRLRATVSSAGASTNVTVDFV